jgi:hypothetical protein
MAMVNGDIDNRLVDLIAGDILRAANLKFDRSGRSNIRCVALRFDTQGGNAEARALLADTSLAKVDGSGSINLGSETLALRVRPALKIGGQGIGIPVLVNGPLTSPGYQLDPAGAAAGAAAAAAGIAGGSSPLEALGGAVRGQQQGGNKGDECAQALAVVRGGRQGPTPAAEPSPPTQQQQRPQQPQRPQLPVNPRDLLRNLPSNR